jgi:hypothetical protein
MSKRSRRALTLGVVMFTAMAPVALFAQTASAFPSGASLFAFDYKVVVTTHIKKSNQTVTNPPGVLKGAIDLDNGKLQGSISLPPAVSTTSEAGMPALTSTIATVSLKPVIGHVNFSTLKVTSTSVFNIRIKTMYAAVPKVLGVTLPAPKVNLVGNSCITVAPVSVTMSGIAHLDGSPSKFSGTFSIPNFKNCGSMTNVINQQIPGGGNSFSAIATTR